MAELMRQKKFTFSTTFRWRFRTEYINVWMSTFVRLLKIEISSTFSRNRDCDCSNLYKFKFIEHQNHFIWQIVENERKPFASSVEFSSSFTSLLISWFWHRWSPKYESVISTKHLLNLRISLSNHFSQWKSLSVPPIFILCLCHWKHCAVMPMIYDIVCACAFVCSLITRHMCSL